MKNLNLIQLSLLCLILYSCHSKPEIKEQLKQPRVDYAIQNYKFDDDEIAKRKKDTLVKKPITKDEKIDSSLAKK